MGSQRKRSGAMREHKRTEILRSLLAERGFLSIADVMAATGVSAASARRDAGRLAVAGLAQRIHGGIHALESSAARIRLLAKRSPLAHSTSVAPSMPTPSARSRARRSNCARTATPSSSTAARRPSRWRSSCATEG